MSNSKINIPSTTSFNRPIRSEYRCHTRTTRFQCEFTWTIQHFKLYIGNNPTEIKSLSFSAAEDTCRWILAINVPNTYYSNTIKLWLRPYETKFDFDNCGPITGELRCSIIDSSGQKQNSQEKNFTFSSTNNSGAGFDSFIKDRSMLADTKLFPGDNLTIHCMVSYIRQGDTTHYFDRHCSSVLNAYLSYPMEDFRKLFNNDELSDVTIHIGDKVYPGHKLILMMRSSVFKAMLTHDMKENHSNRIDIDDIDEKIFQEVLRYIYTEKVENMAFDLLLAADKYDLGILKMMCENELCRMLATDTAVKILSFSNTHDLEKLKNRAMEYIKMNTKKIICSDSWNDLASQPDLMKAVLEA